MFSLLSDSRKLIVSSPLMQLHRPSPCSAQTHTNTRPWLIPAVCLSRTCEPPCCSRSSSIVQWIKGKTSIAYSVSMSSIRGTDDSDHPLRGWVAGWYMWVCVLWGYSNNVQWQQWMVSLLASLPGPDDAKRQNVVGCQRFSRPPYWLARLIKRQTRLGRQGAGLRPGQFTVQQFLFD